MINPKYKILTKNPVILIGNIMLMLYLSMPAFSLKSDTINLAGEWQYRLVGAPTSIPGEGQINLPSTLDASHKSVYNPESNHTSQLRREFSFAGEADFSRRIFIPGNWDSKEISLILERTKPSTLYVDGNLIGSVSRISSPQRYDLSNILTPGSHLIEIRVNNADSLPPTVRRSSHAASESTQTNWNGILGDMFLLAKNTKNIRNIKIKDDVAKRGFQLSVMLNSPVENASLDISINGKRAVTKTLNDSTDTVSMFIPLPDEIGLWSAGNPSLFTLRVALKDEKGRRLDEYETVTGIRELIAAGKGFEINGMPEFLRGTVNAAVFPSTAYAPLDKESWIRYFNLLKEYGFNHVRFHSWTPPEAAFSAADETGFYIQAELPMWGELDRDMTFHNRFLKEDLEGIIDSYSLHPSFVLFSTGNELWGDISLMGEYMREAKVGNPRLLSTYGSNVYLGMNGHIEGEDFLIAAKIGDNIENSVRGSVSFADSPSGGHFNSVYPNSEDTFEKATSASPVPVISHETGQYQIYPDFTEIEKFTGPLKADNLKEFKKRAQEVGTYRKNKEFSQASGKWASKLYKAEMEMALRSPGIAGYQLFGLQDYPGQGTSLIGLLDSFMESKGYISPEIWRESAGPLTILAELPRFSFSPGESVEIPVLTANFTNNPDSIRKITWKLGTDSGDIDVTPGLGVIENDAISFKFPQYPVPVKQTLFLTADDNKTSNSYDLWIYPEKTSEVNNVVVTDNLTEALILLDQGERVILCPDSLTTASSSIGPLFTNDFWNYRMFRTICDEMGLTPSPGTLGLYVNKEHPALAKFPTENHTDWQWFPIIANSRPLIIDRLPKDFDPIIEVIDNVERNFRLALMLECNVGKGKLIILAADMKKAAEFPEGKWLLSSVKEYAGNKDFKPLLTLTPEQIVNLLTKPSTARKIKELKNETYNSHWD